MSDKQLPMDKEAKSRTGLGKKASEETEEKSGEGLAQKLLKKVAKSKPKKDQK